MRAISALEKAGEAYLISPATADPAHREVVFFCMLFSWRVDERVGRAGLACWPVAVAKAARADFNLWRHTWQLLVLYLMFWGDTQMPDSLCGRFVS